MNCSCRLSTPVTAFLVLLASAATAATAATKPNILVILADDMGFSDLGCYGSEIPTPNIDRLAAGGLRFTQFYNTGRCCPTRASLLTGLYSHQVGVGHMTEDRGQPGYRGFLNDRCVTLADVLGSAGYFTAISGKWHVGHRELSMWPLQRGFDRFYGVPEGGGFYYRVKPGRSVALGNEVLYSADKPTPDGWYSTDAWTDWGLKFIDEAAAAGKPFFLHVCHNAPHFPLQAPAEDIARFRGKYLAGWDRLREERHARQIEMGLVDKSWPLAERPSGVKAWHELTDQEKERADHIMAIYAAVVYHMDQAVGRLVDGLKERGLLDNTLILLMSDNGGTAEGGTYGRLDGEPPGGADSNVYCGECWALLENTPLRRYKRENHEGGIATPLIVHWPAGIDARRQGDGETGRGGRLVHSPAHVIDIMPTLVEVAGAKYPPEMESRSILPMEGRSLVPAFANRPIEREALYWEHEGNAALRVGDWKLVRLGRNRPWELYNLKLDRTEQHNLAGSEPDRARELADQWEAWSKRAQVVPAGESGKPAGKKKAAKKKEQ